MANDLRKESPDIPTDPQALRRLERYAELGEFGELPVGGLPSVPRYLVTYMNSQTQGRVRSATVVSVTNQSDKINRVFVSYFKGFSDNNSPVGVTAFAIPPDYTVDFSSRDLPGELTVCNSICNPELVFDEGRAIVSSMWPEIGVSSRVYYTAGERDEQLLAITDSKVVVFRRGNRGD
ncbi:MAG: hypothetical protein M3276_04090 [Actinomycetota bacterium]|nr:hypothetical protein [Actinomycetota bacterium]